MNEHQLSQSLPLIIHLRNYILQITNYNQYKFRIKSQAMLNQNM